jgi:hypothetical protein
METNLSIVEEQEADDEPVDRTAGLRAVPAGD